MRARAARAACSPVPHQDSENATWFQPAGCLAFPSQPLHHYISPASPAMMTNDSQRKRTAFLIALFHSVKCKSELYLHVLCLHHDPSTECYNLIFNWDGTTLALSKGLKGRPWMRGAKQKEIKRMPQRCQHLCRRKLTPTVIKVQRCAPCSGNTSTPPAKTETLQTVGNTPSPTGDDSQRLWNAV